MTELVNEPINIAPAEARPDGMNIIQLRRHCVAHGHTGVGRMKKVDLLALLAGGAPPSLDGPKALPKPKLVRPTNIDLSELKQFDSEPVRVMPPSKTPGINMIKLRSNVKGLVAKCENPELLLRVMAMLQ